MKFLKERGLYMKDSQPIIIGVTGGSGSGKTSVSRAIFNNFPDHSIMMLENRILIIKIRAI